VHVFRRRLRLAANVIGSRIWLLAGLSVASITAHAFWFHFAERHSDPTPSWSDAIWVSLVSITTIGYGDVHAQTSIGRLGLVFLIVFGLAPAAGLLASLPDAFAHIRQRRETGMVPVNARDHVVIINFPSAKRVATVVREFLADPLTFDKTFAIVAEEIERLPDEVRSLGDVVFVHGSPLSADALEQANIGYASRAVVLAKNSDDANSDGITASTVQMIEAAAPDVFTVAECLDDAHLPLFKATGADAVVRSGGLVASLLVQASLDPGVARIVRRLVDNTEEYTLYAFTSTLEGFSVGELIEKFRHQDITLIGIVRGGEDMINPPDDWQIEDGDRLCVISAERRNWVEVENRVSAEIAKDA